MNRRTLASLAVLFICVSAHAQVTQDKPACTAAMQVLGHNGEQLLHDWNLLGELGGDLDASLALAKNAALYVETGLKVTTGDEAFCARVNKEMYRIYPARLDAHDHMSQERLVSTWRQLSIVASTKPQLESEASRDISH